MRAERMSPLDASFLYMEDSSSHLHMGSVGIFEGPPPSYREVAALVASKLSLVPRYRQVVRMVPLDLGHPVWVDDSRFNLEQHIRHTTLPEPGGEAELRKLVGRLMSYQLDRTKPLWEIWMVEGLEDGRWATLVKVHHCMVDGVSGTNLLSLIMDLVADPPPRPADRWQPEVAPSAMVLAAQALVDLARRPYEQFRAVQARLRVPHQTLRQLPPLISGVSASIGLVRPTARSSLNGPIGPHRHYAWASSSVDDIKAVRKAHGGTFNDVVLAAITRGFRDLVLSRQESVDRTVRTLVPVSVRARDSSGRAVGDGTLQNKISGMIAELPVGVVDPLERFRTITAQMEGLKQAKQAVAAEAVTALSAFAPPVLFALGTRLAARAPQRSLNTVTTNVPGPEVPLYLAGRRMLRAFPYMPVAGQIRIGVAIFSFNGQVNFGVTGDYHHAPDIEILCAGIEAGMAELLELAG